MLNQGAYMVQEKVKGMAVFYQGECTASKGGYFGFLYKKTPWVN